MRLFEIDETHNVRPNKQWIGLIPEFALLLRRDKGSVGDSDGRKKLKSRKELAYIYFVSDFGSPIRDWLPEEKIKEAMYYAGLTENDLKDEGLQEAIKKYQELQYKNARSLRSYNAMKKGLDNLDTHMENVDFTLTDKKGELLHDPNKHAALIERMTSVYEKLRNFEKFVEDDLKANPDSIQGSRTLGDQEARRNPTVSTWSESEIASGSANTAEGSEDKGKTFGDMEKLVHTQRKTYADTELEDIDVLEDDHTKK